MSFSVLRDDDNSEKPNPYIDTAIGKKEPIEKVPPSPPSTKCHIACIVGPQTGLLTVSG